MSEKPSYLGLLNAVALAETAAEEYLNCWAEVTPSDEVRQVLQTIALREGEHGKAFAKRICELGYGLKEKPGGRDGAAAMEIASSTTLTDREKFEKLRLAEEPPEGRDIFSGFFDDQTIDIQTGALLGRYIAEERDSGRMFRACYQKLCEAEESGQSSSELAEIHERLDSIEASLKKLAKKR